MSNQPGDRAFVLFIVAGLMIFACVIMFGLLNKSWHREAALQREAIELGYAKHDAATGEWGWLSPPVAPSRDQESTLCP